MLDEQSGNGANSFRKINKGSGSQIFGSGEIGYTKENVGYSDKGGASRFFYCAKSSKRERGEGNNHPTVKPIALMEYLIRLVTPPKGIVLDPFLGSGTTIIAAERTKRTCYGLEIDPTYCDVIVARWEAYTGKVAVLDG